MSEEYIKDYIKASKVNVGDIIIIKGRPCKVIEVTKSKTGKHGHAKIYVRSSDPDDEMIYTMDEKIETINSQ